jgi:hypothetical protein
MEKVELNKYFIRLVFGEICQLKLDKRFGKLKNHEFLMEDIFQTLKEIYVIKK